ncbi:MAG: choice-of-anchor V domain-containing protein [Myxococcaceae bacterium]
MRALIGTVTALSVSLVPAPAFATGIGAGSASFTGKMPGLDCKFCHKGTPASTLTLEPPPPLTANTPANLKLTIAGGPAGTNVGGLCVEVTGGTIAAVSDNLVPSDAVLCQPTETALPAGTATYEFALTPTAATVTVFASSAIGPANNVADDDHAAVLKQDITVAGGSAVSQPTPGGSDAGTLVTGSEVQGSLGCSSASALPVPLVLSIGVMFLGSRNKPRRDRVALYRYLDRR